MSSSSSSLHTHESKTQEQPKSPLLPPLQKTHPQLPHIRASWAKLTPSDARDEQQFFNTLLKTFEANESVRTDASPRFVAYPLGTHYYLCLFESGTPLSNVSNPAYHAIRAQLLAYEQCKTLSDAIQPILAYGRASHTICSRRLWDAYLQRGFDEAYIPEALLLRGEYVLFDRENVCPLVPPGAARERTVYSKIERGLSGAVDWFTLVKSDANRNYLLLVELTRMVLTIAALQCKPCGMMHGNLTCRAIEVRMEDTPRTVTYRVSRGSLLRTRFTLTSVYTWRVRGFGVHSGSREESLRLNSSYSWSASRDLLTLFQSVKDACVTHWGGVPEEVRELMDCVLGSGSRAGGMDEAGGSGRDAVLPAESPGDVLFADLACLSHMTNVHPSTGRGWERIEEDDTIVNPPAYAEGIASEKAERDMEMVGVIDVGGRV